MKVKKKLTFLKCYSSQLAALCVTFNVTFNRPLETPAFGTCPVAVNKCNFCETKPALSVCLDLGNSLQNGE